MSGVVYLGTVTSLKDPDGLGRVKVKLLGMGATVELPWLRTVQMTANGSKGGTIWLPEVGDEVVVLRGDGDRLDSMLVLGSVYNGKKKPAVQNDDKNETKQILTPGKNLIKFFDKSGQESITISTGDTKVVVTLAAKDKSMTVKALGPVSILADKDITIKTPTNIIVECKDAKVKCSGNAKVEVSMNADVKAGQNVKVEAGMNVDIKGGMMVKVAGAAGKGEFGPSGVKISGPMIEIG